jgi:hypothetical protein
MKDIVFILSGAPRAGKDTFMLMLMASANNTNLRVTHMSSIGPITQLLTQIGIDVSNKSNADRELLASIKNALEKHSNYSTYLLINAINKAFVYQNINVFVTQIREADNVEKLKNHYKGRHNVKAYSVLIRNTKAEEACPNNPADQDWKNIQPDIVIDNNGDLVHLNNQTQQLMKSIQDGKEFN